MSEIVEVEEDSRSVANSNDGGGGGGARDVYVAVGKDDLDVLKWALDHAVSPGARVFLVHVCPPVTHIPTPVGKLSKSQLSRDQVRFYMNEENNRRRNNLQKYIRLCTDAKVSVDTIILENYATAKAILDLIPVLNITNLVMGNKCTPRSRILRKKRAKTEFVRKNAPEYCEVSVVHNGKKVAVNQQDTGLVHASTSLPGVSGTGSSRNLEHKFFNCVCFSVKPDGSY